MRFGLCSLAGTAPKRYPKVNLAAMCRVKWEHKSTCWHGGDNHVQGEIQRSELDVGKGDEKEDVGVGSVS